MPCPTLSQLPPPPPGRSGWPWTEESPQLPATMPDGSPWPRISIVTPSYNQGQFIEETIRSVLLQGYPDLEYIIMDGGSTDESVEIIHKYEPWLARWVSERDGGQSNALNKGFARATGALLGWINSDDLLAENTLGRAARAWLKRRPSLVFGNVAHTRNDAQGIEFIVYPHSVSFSTIIRPWLKQCVCDQPGSFFHADVYRSTAGINNSLVMAMDFDLMARMLALHDDAEVVDETFAYFRAHPGSKTAGSMFYPSRVLMEQMIVTRQFWQSYDKRDRLNWHFHFATQSWKRALANLARRRGFRPFWGNLRCGLTKTNIVVFFVSLPIAVFGQIGKILTDHRTTASASHE